MSFPEKCIVDTNVPKNASMSLDPDKVPTDLGDCVIACIEAIEHVMKKQALVIDDGDEIFDEYRKQLSLKGQPGVGDRFMKWVHDNRWQLPDSNRVTITKNGETYNEFPAHDDLHDFDNSDRKFVAVANAHPSKPPILQATDSKWWGWKDALREVGVSVDFLCQEYIKAIYAEKMGS